MYIQQNHFAKYTKTDFWPNLGTIRGQQRPEVCPLTFRLFNLYTPGCTPDMPVNLLEKNDQKPKTKIPILTNVWSLTIHIKVEANNKILIPQVLGQYCCAQCSQISQISNKTEGASLIWKTSTDGLIMDRWMVDGSASDKLALLILNQHWFR